jgi:glycosyltransferase involved in cell wall biosynthesis
MRNVKQKGKVKVMADKPLVSVVIPTYNGHKTIVQCLETVTNQQTDFPYEVIVVDSSPEPVEPLIKPRFPQVKYVHSERRLSAAEARNWGVKLASGDLVAFVDCDILLPNNWLNHIVNLLREKEIYGVGCAIANKNKYSIPAWIVHLAEFPRSLPGGHPHFVESFPAGACCYRRSVFQEFQFPPTLGAGGEEPALNIALTRKGMKLLHDPTIAVEHPTPSRWKDVFLRPFKTGKADGFCACQSETRATLFARFPVLLFAYPFLRTVYSGWHCFRSGLKYGLLFTVLSPFIFVAYCAWAIGIYLGVREFQRRKEVGQERTEGGR